MAHAGTMELGRNVQSKPSGNPWTSVALVVAVAIAIVAGTMFALNAGFVGKAARPADRSYDAIEAQRGTVNSVSVLSGKSADDIALGRTNSYDIEAQRGLFAGTAPICHGFSPTSGLAFSYACSTAAVAPVAPAARIMVAPGKTEGDYPFTVTPRATTQSLSSGTFQLGNPAVGEPITPLPGLKTIDNPVNRDRFGGR